MLRKLIAAYIQSNLALLRHEGNMHNYLLHLLNSVAQAVQFLENF